MKKLLMIISIGLIGFTTSASANVAKGQKLYSKKLKKTCEFSGAKMASKHSQDEWEQIMEAGTLSGELKKICPSLKEKSLKDKYLEHYFDFFYEYASDSGNVPSC